MDRFIPNGMEHVPVKMTDIQVFLKHYAKLWQQSLHMERTFGKAFRMPFSFPDISRYGEALCALLSGLKGSASKGSGADLSDGRIQDEVKTVCLCQPSKCKKCSHRSPWTDSVCAHCGSDQLKPVTDSRCLINASAHIKNRDTLRQYWFVTIEHTAGDVFRTTVWTIQANNPYFVGYIEEQAKQTSKDCNLLPRSYDFMLSSPKRMLTVDMTLPSDIESEPSIGELNRTETIEDVISAALLKSKERIDMGLSKDDKTSNLKIEDMCRVLGARKKAHGKIRGTTSRGVGE